ncbi:MAG: HAMP domain-containing histidine kinase [Lachnospiraceae bacterium]|nr:HAMP domain-containing histidine kinase [Lachnospiraceae bacterium]
MRVQVLIVFIIIGLVPLYLFSAIITDAYESKLVSQRVDELQSYGTMISNLVISSGYLLEADAVEVDTEAAEIAEVYQGRIMLVDQNLRIIKDTYGLETGKTVISTEVVQCFNGTGSKYVNELGEYMQLTMPIIDSSDQQVSGVIIMSFSTKNLHIVADAVKQKVYIVLLVFTILLLLGAFVYSALLTKPLKKVTDSIDEISQGDMDVKIDMRGFSEISSISDSFNQMIDVIRKQEKSRQEFVSNVSHELKTPLASMKVLSDSLLSQEGMPEELYREFLGDITEEIERMTEIINDLLSMVKLDKNSAQMQVVNISINDLLEQLLKRLRPIAAKRNIELVYESYRPVMADVDEVKISMALNNLIENAIKYNYDDGWVRVTLNADHKFFYVTVQDSGVGIPEDVQDSVFERFFRVDKARSRDTGGTGLGLSLTRSAVLLHRGSIKLHSKEKEGTTFTVRIPLNYIP